MKDEDQFVTFILLATLGLILLADCSSKANDDNKSSVEPCTFTNPVTKGQDPWVTQKGDYYYYIESRNGGLYVSKSKQLTNIKEDEALVWSLRSEERRVGKECRAERSPERYKNKGRDKQDITYKK